MPNRPAFSSSSDVVVASTEHRIAGRAARSPGRWLPTRPRAGVLGLGGLALAIMLAGCDDSSSGPAAAGTNPPPPPPPPPAEPDGRLLLRDGWAIHSSAGLAQGGDALSAGSFDPQGWTPTRVPSTVVAAQIANGDLPDPNIGMNMREIPGTTDYPSGGNFSLFDMTESNPYRPSWWYRTDFELPLIDTNAHTNAHAEGRTWLHFDGINYRANIWLNGKLIASDKDVAGSYRRYAFDVTGAALPGQRNALAIEIFAPGKSDLAPSFIDWNPAAADKNMGLWQDVYLTTTGPVKVQHPFVVSKVDSPSLATARLTVNADLVNATDAAVKGTLKGTIDDIEFSEEITLAPHETKAVSLDPEKHPELVIASPKLWWPYQLGPQNLHDLGLEFAVEGDDKGAPSDRSTSRFGIREVTMDLVDGLWASYKVNGKPIFIRGGGYTSDMLFRFSDQRDEQEMQLVKDMGLNTIRIEGKLANDHLFDVADREGILVIAGWECCSVWEYWNDSEHDLVWNDTTSAVARASLESQLLRLRGRPSVLAWLYGSDGHPPPDLEQLYLDVVEQTKWPLPAHNQASERDPSTLTGPSGFKMPGPYDYVPPVYWYVDNTYGGAFGFNSETGPGAAVPNVESLKKFIPEDKLWPMNEVWSYHMGGTQFANLDMHTDALEGRYGAATSLEDYAMKAQAIAYDDERAMFEAYRRNKGKTTGVIAWMLNNGWPSMLWHLYDYYLAAGGGYYGTKKGNELVHIQYSYDDRTVVAVNDSPEAVVGLKATVEMYDFELTKVFSKEQGAVDVPTDKSVVVAALPEIPDLTPTYFVKLLLRDAQDQVVSENFYWLSTKADVLAWDQTDWWGTPTTEHADLTELNTLPQVTPTVTAAAGATDKDREVRVTVQNDTDALAFMVRFRVTKGMGGGEILPSTWSDNYLSLLPGETRQVTAHFAADVIGNDKPVVVVSGWNVPELVITP